MRRVIPEPFPEPLVRDAVAFGQAVRAARTRAGITLQAAAEALNISKATLGDLEGGKGTVALGTAIRVARDLGVSLMATPMLAHFDATLAIQKLRSEQPELWGTPGSEQSPSEVRKRRRAEKPA